MKVFQFRNFAKLFNEKHDSKKMTSYQAVARVCHDGDDVGLCYVARQLNTLLLIKSVFISGSEQQH